MAAKAASNRPAPACVLFDLDGTLVDSLADLHTSINHVLARYGRAALGRDEVRGFVGDGARVLLARSLLGKESAAGTLGAEPERQAAIAALLERARAALAAPTLDEAVQAFRACYAEHVLDQTRAYPGVEAMLARLAGRGVALGVVTNKPQLHTEKILAGLGLADRFGAVVGGDGAAGQKPSPEPLREALRVLGRAPAESLMVGDSRNDMLAGRAAGCRTALITWGFAGPDALAREAADWVIERAEELCP